MESKDCRVIKESGYNLKLGEIIIKEIRGSLAFDLAKRGEPCVV